MDFRVLRDATSPVEQTPQAVRCPKCGAPMSLALLPGGEDRVCYDERPDPLRAGDVVG
jgi:hypothetical protein